jgi:alpha-beta hydrolase superfamily lysophospholipase
MRGSVSVRNWVTDFKYDQRDCSDLVPGGQCERGFWDYWYDSKPELMKGLSAAQAEHPDYEIILTGHSLGGAAAVIGAVDLRKSGMNLTLVCFQMPRYASEARILTLHSTLLASPVLAMKPFQTMLPIKATTIE